LASTRSRRTPSSPVFPYTTLFRSRRQDEEHRDEHRLPRGLGEGGDEDADRQRGEHERQRDQQQRRPTAARPDAEDESRQADGEEDRKSTRLNSSHSQISYAVFCLK